MFQAEDYQALFGELQAMDPNASTEPATGTEPVVTEPATVTDPNVVPTVPVTEPQASPDGSTTEPADPAQAQTEPAPADPVDPDGQLKARAFAELRATNTKYSKVFKQLQGYMGASNEDEVIQKLLDVAINVQAKSQGTDPEVLKRINMIESKNQELENNERMRAVNNAFTNLQNSLNLSNVEVMNFAKDLDRVGFDLFNSSLDLATIYRGMHHEELLQKQVEAERQAQLKKEQEAGKAPGVINAVGKKSGDKKVEINTMGEFESLFNTLNIK